MVKFQFRINIDVRQVERLDEFCSLAGARRSDVIEGLIKEHLQDLIEKVAELSKKIAEEEDEKKISNVHAEV